MSARILRKSAGERRPRASVANPCLSVPDPVLGLQLPPVAFGRLRHCSMFRLDARNTRRIDPHAHRLGGDTRWWLNVREEEAYWTSFGPCGSLITTAVKNARDQEALVVPVVNDKALNHERPHAFTRTGCDPCAAVRRAIRIDRG